MLTIPEPRFRKKPGFLLFMKGLLFLQLLPDLFSACWKKPIWQNEFSSVRFMTSLLRKRSSLKIRIQRTDKCEHRQFQGWLSDALKKLTKFALWRKSRKTKVKFLLFQFRRRATNRDWTKEFDPGSDWTLAACFTHASRTAAQGACSRVASGARVSNTSERVLLWGITARKGG